MLPKKNRLRKNFQAIIKQGKRKKTSYFIIFCRENNLSASRFGIIITKKIGKAVIRNMVRRRVKEIIKEYVTMEKSKEDIIIIPSKFIQNWKEVSFNELYQDLLNALLA